MQVTHSSIALLLMIRNITHNTHEKEQGTMALAESFLESSTTFQEMKQSVEVYYKLFKAQVDTVNAHDRISGYHYKLYNMLVVQ